MCFGVTSRRRACNNIEQRAGGIIARLIAPPPLTKGRIELSFNGRNAKIAIERQASCLPDVNDL